MNLDWSIFWATNKKHIDPTASRYTAVDTENKVKVNIIGTKEGVYSEMKPKHAKYDLGNKKPRVQQASVIVDRSRCGIV